MRYLPLTIFLSTALSLSACQDKPAPASGVVTVAPEQAPKPAGSLAQQLVAFYPTHALPLQLSTQKLNGNPDLPDSLLQGRLIPQPLLPVFGDALRTEGKDAFALAKLPLPNHKVGLVTRVLGEYVSSRIVLYVLDEASGNILDQCEVAETYGDAGDAYIRSSTLTQDASQQVLIQVSQQHCSPVNRDISNITCVDSTLVYRLRDGHFTVLSRKPKR